MHRTFALLFGLIAVALGSSAYAETLKVAVSQRGFWDSTMVDIAEKQGFFKEAGLEIEVLYTEGGASTLTPLLAGSIDIAMSNGILGVIGAYSKGAPVRISSAGGTGAAARGRKRGGGTALAKRARTVGTARRTVMPWSASKRGSR